MKLEPVGAPKRPHLAGNEYGTALVATIDAPWARDTLVWTDDSIEGLGAAQGYTTFETALSEARKLTAGADDGTAAIFKADNRFFLQHTYTEGSDMVSDDWIPFELTKADYTDTKVLVEHPDVLALVNGDVAGKVDSEPPKNTA